MNLLRSFVSFAAACAVAPSLSAATRAELQADYVHVRKIALKDPGVRAAYAKADAKLNAKILEIDPSLKPIVEGGGASAKPAATKPAAAKKPSATRATAGSSYVVAKGDTLTSIASRYGISATELKSANGIVDERKLRIGQKLTIPGRNAAAPAAPKEEDSLWLRLKGGR